MSKTPQEIIEQMRKDAGEIAKFPGVGRDAGELVKQRADELEAALDAWLKPDFPPFPPEGEGLPRYGLRWNGPDKPLAVPMEDGYWTPWHLAVRQSCPTHAMDRATSEIKGLLSEGPLGKNPK